MARLSTTSTCVHTLELSEEERLVLVEALRYKLSRVSEVRLAYRADIKSLIDLLTGAQADG